MQYMFCCLGTGARKGKREVSEAALRLRPLPQVRPLRGSGEAAATGEVYRVMSVRL